MHTLVILWDIWNIVLYVLRSELLDKPNFQGNAAVNYTDRETPWTRIIEHKWFEFGKDADGNDLPKTVISREYSSEWKPGDEPYYPVNDEKNGAALRKIQRTCSDRRSCGIWRKTGRIQVL